MTGDVTKPKQQEYKIVEKTQELFKAYNDVMASGFAAFNTSVQQSNVLMTGMMDANVKMVETSQEFAKNSVKYGEAYMEWLLDTTKSMAPKAQS